MNQEPAEPTQPSIAPEIRRKVERALESWKRDLIDFSKRNKLLYFNSSRRTRLRLVAPAPGVLYEGLVLREKPFAFASPMRGDIDLIELQGDDEVSDVVERSGDVDVDYEQSSAKDVLSLQKKLYRLRTDARSTLNEQGINTLHLSIGTLRWKETDLAADWIQSPLILVPVGLDREKNGPYRLTGFEGDVLVNPTLAHRLRHDFELELPSLDPFDGFGEEPDPLGFLEEVRRTTHDLGWSVEPDMWLSHFSFEKLVMFEDLSKPGTVEAIADHPVLSALVGLGDAEPGVSFETKVADYEQPEAYPVVDADSSQIGVLMRARTGANVVVQGPPGTGKSQTIVNLIAQAIRDNQSVLFVSEKRAALEVVYRRLRETQLAELCLELHSHKANKREVVNDLYLALQGTRSERAEADRSLFNQRRDLRERLDAYVRALHEPRGAGGRRAFDVHGELAALHDVPSVLSDLPIEDYVDHTLDAEAELVRELDDVVRPSVWGREGNHPWKDFVVESPVFVAVQEIVPVIESLIPLLEQVAAVRKNTKKLLGVEPTDGVDGLPALRDLLDRVAHLPDGARAEWLSGDRGQLASDVDLAKAAASRSRSLVDTATRLDELGAPRLAQAPELVAELLLKYRDSYQGRLARLSSAYRRDRKQLRESCDRKLRFIESYDALQVASQHAVATTWLADHTTDLRRMSGRKWPVDLEQVDGTVATISRCDLLRAYVSANGFPIERARALVADIEVARGSAMDLLERLSVSLEQTPEILDRLASWMPDGFDGVPLGRVPVESLLARIRPLPECTPELGEWVDFERAQRACRERGLGPFLDQARSKAIPGAQLGPALRRSIAMRWITEVYGHDQMLGQFSAENHSALIEKFRKLDKDLLTEARQAVRHAASERQKEVRAAAAFARQGGRAPEEVRPAREEFKLLQKEFSKTRRHKPLRRLLPELPIVLPAVKPCLLMSPLSVASYLPRDRFRFDLVIFDEASQVLPADAVGAILRAKQVVVLGDSKQLPPTTFFQRRLDDGDDDDGDDLDDTYVDSAAFDSILDLCAGAMPQQEWLRWHYRSRDERLIAFSNRTFYHERPLITFPTANPGATDTGVSFEYVSDGIYDRGGSRTNVREAERVADRIVEHFDTHGWSRSLGVITLGIAQRDQILYELRKRTHGRPDLDPFIENEGGAEPFFVKNLETVQGDERDDIILSLGFGPSEPGGKPALAFGPVSVAGGERRLNVAVTRAKFSMTIISSMRPEDLDRTDTLKNEGPRVLASYLRYAARGGRFDEGAVVDPSGEPESPFEEAVSQALRNRGYQVDAQVGVSGFRIDLGVRHPDRPTRYVLGVECDGATYHRSASARDRDRLRQEILEEQGWHIHRIWSTDWIQHPNLTCDTVVAEIERLRSLPEPGTIRRAPTGGDEDVASEAAEPGDHVESGPAEPAGTAPSPAAPGIPEISVLPTPFIEEQKGSLLYEQRRLEQQLESIHDQQSDIKGQSDKGYSSDQIGIVLEQRLENVLAALADISRGIYGTCRKCGRSIEIERLEAVPSARLCRECSGSS